MSQQVSRMRRGIAVFAVAGCAAVLGSTPALAASAHTAPSHPATTITVPYDYGHVCKSKLPSQADDTLKLIASGGPFPYPEDGEVFRNDEGVLPQEPSGYYHSYTVKTPGSSDRGARRIVTAKDGDDFYTANHYDSFDEITFSC